MISDLWPESKMMGIHCPVAAKVPKEWFFCRHERPIIDHNRYQLDFNNSGVRTYANGIIRRLVEKYGVGYIKMDYNIDGAPSAETGAATFVVAKHPICHHQTNYIKMAAIAANCTTGATPKQVSIWSYPLIGADEEATALNMVNSMRCCIHQSGYLFAGYFLTEGKMGYCSVSIIYRRLC